MAQIGFGEFTEPDLLDTIRPAPQTAFGEFAKSDFGQTISGVILSADCVRLPPSHVVWFGLQNPTIL